MMVWNILIAILAIIGMASTCCAIIMIVTLTKHGSTPDDDRHRLEDEEQAEYLRRWNEKNGSKTKARKDVGHDNG